MSARPIAVATPAEEIDRRTELRRTLEGVIGVPMTEGNAVRVLRNGNEIFPAMLHAIGSAEHTIDLLTFIYWSGGIGTAFADALAERARAGLRVRVLLDGWGAHPIDHALLDCAQQFHLHLGRLAWHGRKR